jgi:hypothetical protein
MSNPTPRPGWAHPKNRPGADVKKAALEAGKGNVGVASTANGTTAGNAAALAPPYGLPPVPSGKAK